MSVTAQGTESYTIGGKTFTKTVDLVGLKHLVVEQSIPAAWPGTLGTRTNNTDGALTVLTGHGITTGQRIDIYWNGGQRRGVTAGTIAAPPSDTSIPFTGGTGSGSNLPSASTVIQVAAPTSITLSLIGNNVNALAFYSDAYSQFVIADNTPTEQYSRILPAGTGYCWHANNGDANPLSGVTSTQVFISHSQTSGPATCRVGAQLTV